jgi:hypothetical protein
MDGLGTFVQSVAETGDGCAPTRTLCMVILVPPVQFLLTQRQRIPLIRIIHFQTTTDDPNHPVDVIQISITVLAPVPTAGLDLGHLLTLATHQRLNPHATIYHGLIQHHLLL